MDLLPNVPNWGEIERNLEQKFSDLNQSAQSSFQSAQDGWNGFTRRVSNGASAAYGHVGGYRIDHVRQAMALSYPIMLTNLTRKWASINIAEILPVLVKLVQEVVMIVGSSVLVGAAVGGAVGSLAFGAGALPGTAIGGGIGLQVGNLIMGALGLYAITGYFSDNLWPCILTMHEGLSTAWLAEEGLEAPGLDPSGGSAAMIQERTELAARRLAQGQEQLVLLLLMAISTYLMRGQMRAGVGNSLESIATRSAQLQSQISNKELAAWLSKNESLLLEHPELQIRGVTSLETLERKSAMREFYAEQDPDFKSVEQTRKFAKAFEPAGLSRQQIRDYLMSPAGKEYLKKVILADPKASEELLYERAFGHIASGSTVPVTTRVTTGLVKIVPLGEKRISDYSPFFTTMDELKAAANSDKTLADALGLPVISENARYSIFEINPLEPTDVFFSKVAPTVEFGGNITRTGGATQYLVPNRSEWSAPKLIGEIDN
jgi:hypothetical protein